MTELAAIAAGLLVGTGLYLMLALDLQRVAIGFALLSNGVNLAIIAAAGRAADAAMPLIRDGVAIERMIDPLPQAFVLTAIVIGMGTAALLLALATRSAQELGSDVLVGGGDGGEAP